MGYIENDIKYDYDSIKNQDIKSKFVNREVMACMTSEVEYILQSGFENSNSPFTIDDIENYYIKVCPECGDTYGFTDDENEEGEIIYKCESCNHEVSEDDYDDLDTEPQEVYEWWAVTNWFGEKLRAHDEVVIECYDKTYWGRCSCGQAIMLDGIISKICKGMEILEGQKFDWSDNK